MADDAKGPVTAGSLLRVAREKHGLHIAALAAAMKVAPRKLDALENDRWSELPDATFVRALALTVCRTLKVDSKAVLDLLPPAETMALESIGEHLNAPFRAADGRSPAAAAGQAIRPMVWAAAALMAAAVAVYFAPEDWLKAAPAAAIAVAGPVVMQPASQPALDPASAAAAASTVLTAASAPALPASAVVSSPVGAVAPPAAAVGVVTPSVGETLISAPPASMLQTTAVSGALQLRTSEASWIDVRDARGQVLLSRIVQPGETVGLDGTAPLRMTIGNAQATQLMYRGQAVNLAPNTRENVARIELD